MFATFTLVNRSALNFWMALACSWFTMPALRAFSVLNCETCVAVWALNWLAVFAAWAPNCAAVLLAPAFAKFTLVWSWLFCELTWLVELALNWSAVFRACWLLRPALVKVCASCCAIGSAASYKADCPAPTAMLLLRSPRACIACLARVSACCISGELSAMMLRIWPCTVELLSGVNVLAV